MAYNPFRNPGLKIISVLLATLLWITVSRDQVVERNLRVPLEFQNIPEQLEIVGDAPLTVDVRVRGTSGLLGRLEPGEVVAVVDVRAARPGQRLFHIAADAVRTPFGIQVTQVSPSTVSLEFERSGKRLVPIVPAIEGQPAPGFVAGRVTTSPTGVEVVGPENRLRRLREATTEPVSIEGARSTVKDEVTVGVEDASLRLTQPRTAEVTVEINAAPLERSIEEVPVGIRNLAPGLSAQVLPNRVTVVVRGSREAVSPLMPAAIDAYVELANLGRGRYTLSVRAEGGREHGVLRIDPERVEVRIQ
jgi:YbbR domain-containing protein